MATSVSRLRGDGVDLYVMLDGPADRPAVVLLHGVTASGRSYEWMTPADVGGRRLVRVDLRGHGDSGHAPGTYGVEAYARDVTAVLRVLGGPPPLLVGHSLGGVVAWTVAQRHPELMTAVLLEDPPLYYGEPAEHRLNGAVELFTAMRAALAGWREAGLSAGEIAARIAAAPGGERLPAGGPDIRAGELLSMDVGVLDAVIDGSALAAADVRAPVAVPVRILAADEAAGTAFPARHEARLATSHPEVEVLRVAGATHLIHDETATRETYRRELAAFADRHA